ncbi:MAG: ABC transporter ATP-binding protein [Gammaproteobacteria bacterium]|nr:ABC transporter ATP-binding protein [Gammaproteobacteria bacterium]
MTRLVARALAFGYRHHPVGDGVDLDVGGGGVLCLLGPNGSGKTTLFKTLLGLLPRLGGHIELDGRDIATLPHVQVARHLAYVPQGHESVFPYSVHDMVVMGRSAHRGLFSGPTASDRARATDALAELGIADLAGRDYTHLSGGQRQLVLIARALAQDAPLIVMDEPTASLDFGNQLLVLEQVVRLARRGLGIVLSTHNPDHALRCATRVLLLKDGRLLASGRPDDALSEPALSAVYGVAVRVERLSDGQRVCVARDAAVAG